MGLSIHPPDVRLEVTKPDALCTPEQRDDQPRKKYDLSVVRRRR